jgi:hypothetical protein
MGKDVDKVTDVYPDVPVVIVKSFEADPPPPPDKLV